MPPSENPLVRLAALGQSVWLDYIRRGILESGELARLVADDAVSGVTSNPAIFELAIARSDDYRGAIARLAREGTEAEDAYERLALEDIRAAADVLLPVYRASESRDGYVSLEVSPALAHDTEATVREARRLWRAIGRPNAMIKIPATAAGLPAVRRALADGINVNVTLIFSVERYREVVDAFLAGLEDRDAAGLPLDRIASVASFFVSRIDGVVDAALAARVEGPHAQAAAALRGRAAIANSALAWRHAGEWTTSRHWQRLAERGARPQRLLWASTSTKDPQASDVKYVEALIAPNTVNTIPPQTLDAYRDHGDPRSRIEDALAEADAVFAGLATLGIDMPAVCQELEADGVRKFAEAFDSLLDKLGKALVEAAA